MQQQWGGGGGPGSVSAASMCLRAGGILFTSGFTGARVGQVHISLSRETSLAHSRA